MSKETITVRFCSAWTVAPDTLVDGKLWKPAITSGPVFALSTWKDGQPTALDITYGNLSIKIGEAFENLDYQGLNFSGAPASIWFGQAGDPFSSYRRIFAGSMGPIVPDTNNVTATLALLGPEADLTGNLLSLSYAGTGGVEGPSTMLGSLKPLAFGFCTNVAPTLLDSANQIYQVHGYGSCAISAVYEGALSLGLRKANVADYQTLYNLTLDGTKGEWATCTALGLFRLGAQPTNKITADVGSPATVGTIVNSMLGLAGVPDALIDASVATATRVYSLYLTDQAAILDAIRTAAVANERYLIADSAERWHLASAVSTAVPGTLRGDRSSYPLVLTDQVKKETASNPVWRLKIGYGRVWSVNSLSEVAGGFAELGQDLTAARKVADDAEATALAAAADATYAKTRLLNQASDGVLDQTEKLALIHAVEGYTAEQNGLISTANGLGVSAPATAYLAAYNALMAYLNGLVPLYTDLTAPTPIDPRYVDLGVAYLTARSALTNANLAAAALRAEWTSVDNRPLDLSGLDPEAGDKLNGIEVGATNGAPSGSPFGDTTVDDHLAAVQAAHIAQLTSLANADLTRIKDRALTFPAPDGASIYTLHKREETARATADEAFAETFELLGAVTPDGKAFVLDDTTVQVTKTEAGATVYQSVSARFAESEGNIETIQQTFTDGTGTVSRALLRVDADGRVIGYAATNNGNEGDFIVTADRFEIVDPDTGTAYFTADDTGKVVMHNVEVDTIKVGAVDYAALQLGAAQKASWFTVMSDVAVPQNGTNEVARLEIVKEDQDSVLKIQMYAKVKSPDDLQFVGTILVDGYVVDITTVNIVLDNQSSAGQMPITPIAYVPGVAAGAHTVSFTLHNSETDNVSLIAQAGSTLEVVELRKASIGSVTGSGAAIPVVDPVTGNQPVGGSGGVSGGDGGYNGGGGGQAGCPVPSMRILLSNADNTGPGEQVEAGSVRPGEWVWTQHETSREWGAFEVIAARIVIGSPIYRTTFANTAIDTSPSHLFDLGGGWVRADAIGCNTGEVGDVVAITVADAHTYVLEGVLSHNKTSEPTIN